MNLPRFRIITLLFLMAIVALNVALAHAGLFATYLSSLVTVAMLVTYFLRFAFHKPQFIAAIWGVVAAMTWGGGLYSAVSLHATASMHAALLAFLLGVGIGFIVAILPVCTFGLVREPRTRYCGERNPKPDHTISSVLPYIGGSGG